MEYLRDWLAKRPPLMVVLPNGALFKVESRARDSERGWTVTGEPPDITSTPSINYVLEPAWHGFLENGVLRS